jgi:D-3-phosphoglycerate dehydrogenase
MSESAALQWAAIFRGERPPRLVNPEAWPAYVERHTRIVGQPPGEPPQD